MDSLKALIIDTLNRYNVSAHIFSKPDDQFEKNWFPIILIIITALLTFLTSWISTHLANVRADKLADEERRRIKSEQSNTIVHDCYGQINELDRIAVFEINTGMLTGGNESTIIEFGNKLDKLELTFKNNSYRFSDEAISVINKIISSMYKYRLNAYEATVRNGLIAAIPPMSPDYATFRKKADEIKDSALAEFASWRGDLKKLEELMRNENA